LLLDPHACLEEVLQSSDVLLSYGKLYCRLVLWADGSILMNFQEKLYDFCVLSLYREVSCDCILDNQLCRRVICNVERISTDQAILSTQYKTWCLQKFSQRSLRSLSLLESLRAQSYNTIFLSIIREVDTLPSSTMPWWNILL
jgi:hypothetical protein